MRHLACGSALSLPELFPRRDSQLQLRAFLRRDACAPTRRPQDPIPLPQSTRLAELDNMAEPAAPVVPLPATNGEGTFPAPDAAGELVAAIAQAETVSADEIALYDRQIRLWGLEAQNRIRNANILLVSVKALANEIAKNLVLAGIGSITLADHEIITEEDLSAQFFISETDIGKNVRAPSCTR